MIRRSRSGCACISHSHRLFRSEGTLLPSGRVDTISSSAFSPYQIKNFSIPATTLENVRWEGAWSEGPSRHSAAVTNVFEQQIWRFDLDSAVSERSENKDVKK